MRKHFLLLCGLFCSFIIAAKQPQTIDLSGLWRFQLDPMGFGKTPGSELYTKNLTETIVLPGSTDQAGKGIMNALSHIDRLSRKFEYCGQAWYQREVLIPADWKEKEITLTLERCHWETAVFIDGKPVSADERLSTPNRFVLTEQLKPGAHTLTICVDNRLKYPMDQWNHGTTEYTQTNWNGIVGKIQLSASPIISIKQLNVTTSVKDGKITVRAKLIHPEGKGSGELQLSVREKGKKELAKLTVPVTFTGKESEAVGEITLGKKIRVWDEFTPNLYELESMLHTDAGDHVRTVTFGFREVAQGKHHIRLNDRDIHLRGVLDCAVFPQTGYPSTDVNDWKRIFRTVKDYGMNHVRFHSWCPPRAAFDAADELGLYLQAELPMWIKDVGKYPLRRDFFEKEMYAILDEYGNHPSFILMCNGNENEGDFNVLEDLVKKAQAYDNRRLYSASTARTHVKADQYYVSHVTSKGWITVYEGQPSTMWDRRKESDIDVPVIAHETGQRCMYPNFNEIKKYQGVLEPRNFKKFQESLTRKGMLQQADDFFKATGAHTVLQYKEVNEALLRTPNSGGFQLLGLSDFPGQGSAFVGILDAFWETKGLVTPEVYRQSCAPTVLLARFARRTYTNEETFKAGLEIYHYGAKPIAKGKLRWRLENQKGIAMQNGQFAIPAISCATVDSLGGLEISLKAITRPEKLTLKAFVADSIMNQWDIWVYPKAPVVKESRYVYARSWNEETKAALRDGKNVLLIPEKPIGRKARFASHFWNPIMFNWKPMIVGTLIDASHPSLNEFPTATYADWQWWDILNNATAMELDQLQTITPIIQSIDSYETNHKLGIAFEANVGNGKLYVLTVDPKKEISKRPATRQLLASVKNYVGDNVAFKPEKSLQFHELDAVFHEEDATVRSTESEAVKQLLNK